MALEWPVGAGHPGSRTRTGRNAHHLACSTGLIATFWASPTGRFAKKSLENLYLRKALELGAWY